MVVIAVALSVAVAYKVVVDQPPPGPGWIKVGSVADIQRQGVTKIDDSAYVVSYGDLPVFAFAAFYDEGVEGVELIHETVYYCSSSGWFFNEPHATQYDIMGKYKLGPAPSSTLPRVAVTVLDGNVWVNPAQSVPGLVPGVGGINQPAKGPNCQNAQSLDT